MDRATFHSARERAYAKGDFVAARALERQRLKAAPEDWDAWMRASYTEAHLGNYADSARLIERAVKGDPANVVYRRLMHIHFQKAGREHDIAILDATLGGSPDAIARAANAVKAQTARARLANTLDRVLPLWSAAADPDPAPRYAHWLSQWPSDESSHWAELNPFRHKEGDVIDFGDFGRLRCGPITEVIFKRIGRAIPWEVPVATLLCELASRMNPDCLALDIGANVGTLTVPLARHSAGSVLAFEPVPANHLNLIDNLSLNRLATVETRAEALSTAPGHAAMFDVHADNAGTAKLAETPSAGIPVPLARLDDILDGRRVGLIKIDVEGHEVQALTGGQKMMERDRPLVVAEVLGAKRASLLGYFDRLGYDHVPVMRDDHLFYPKG